MKISVILILLVLIAVEAGAELFLTEATQNTSKKKNLFLLLGVVSYILVAIIFYFMIKQQRELTVINTIWQGANIVVVSLCSVIFLKEKLSKLQILGIILTIIGIVLVDLKSSKTS